jgi:hypothetical protein
MPRSTSNRLSRRTWPRSLGTTTPELPSSEYKRRAAAYHEAGNCVARYHACALPLVGARIALRGGSGSTQGTDHKLVLSAPQVWEHAIYALAGVVAESRALGVSVAVAKNIGGKGDCDTVARNVQWLVHRGDVPNTHLAWHQAESATHKFVRRHWLAIERVAQALLRHGALEARVLAKLVGAPGSYIQYQLPNDSSRRFERVVEEARNKYRPRQIRILLVAEAPHAKPERCFYAPAVRAHDALFISVIRAVYSDASDPNRIPVQILREHKGALLSALQRDGFFLVDACAKPMPPHLTLLQRTRRVERELPHLYARLRELAHVGQPIILITPSVFYAAAYGLGPDGFHLVNRMPIDTPNLHRRNLFPVRFSRALKRAGWRPRRSGVFAARR